MWDYVVFERLSMGYFDIHCHLLPGVDDGSRNMDETLEMLRIAAENGITDMIFTPHYKQGQVGTPRSVIEKMIAKVREAAEAEGISMQIHPGTEIYYNSALEEKLESGWLSRMIDSDFVLLEFSPFETFPYIKNAMDDIYSLGYHPILAHVERYQCMLGSVENVRILHKMGVHIQVNAGSVAGDYGFKVKHFIKKLMKEHLIDYIGTDAHNASGRKPAMEKCAEVVRKICDEEYAQALLSENARRDFLED